MPDKSKNKNLNQQIDAYVKGRLSEQEAEKLWVELLKQPAYLERLQTEIDLSRLHNPGGISEPESAYFWKWIAAAAAVVLIMLSVSFLFHQSNTDSIQQWALAEIDLVQNLASAEISRSVQILNPADSLLSMSFQAALLGQTSKATDIYHQIITNDYASDATSKAYLNLGILQYNSGSYAASIDNFNQALAAIQEPSWLKGNLYWYLSNALVHTGQFQDARDAANQAYKMSTMYKQEAFNLRTRLDYTLGKINLETLQQQIKEINN